MWFSVYADLARRLTTDEQSALFEALDRIVPDSGCVGPQKGATDEVYFTVEAHSAAEATALATRYMSIILQEAALAVEYALELQSFPGE
jgi:hypothetical protein